MRSIQALVGGLILVLGVLSNTCAEKSSNAPPKGKGHVRIAAAQPKNRTLDFKLKPADVLVHVDKSLDELEKLVHQAGEAGAERVNA